MSNLVVILAVGAALTPLVFIVALKKMRGGDDK